MTVVQRGRRLEYFTIGWNAIEGGVAVAAGAIAGGIALVGFGLNSFIEVTSGLTLPWRMSVDADVHRRELNEKRALSFLLLAAYVAYESTSDLWSRKTKPRMNRSESSRNYNLSFARRKDSDSKSLVRRWPNRPRKWWAQGIESPEVPD
jgi:hypothetical protein